MGSHLNYGSSPNQLEKTQDPRVPGVQDSSDMLKNYKELNVWQKSYALCGIIQIEIGIAIEIETHDTWT